MDHDKIWSIVNYMKVHTLLWIIGLLFLCLVKEKKTKLNTMSQLIICMQVGPYNGRHGSVELVPVTMFINVRTINWSLRHLETCPTQGHNNAYGSSSPSFISWWLRDQPIVLVCLLPKAFWVALSSSHHFFLIVLYIFGLQ